MHAENACLEVSNAHILTGLLGLSMCRLSGLKRVKEIRYTQEKRMQALLAVIGQK